LGLFVLEWKTVEFSKKRAGAAITHEFLSPAPAAAPSSHWAVET